MPERLIQVGGVEFTVDDHDEHCWVAGDRLGFWDTFAADGYDPQLVALIDRLIRPGRVFVDVGAWVGAFALYAAARGATVVAVEPDPVAFARLETNARLNDHLDTHLFPYAVTAQITAAGSVMLAAVEYGNGLSRIATGGRPVPAATLPQIVATADLGRVDLVKIDVEGYETRLLPTLTPWLVEARAALHVSLHGQSALRPWFAGFGTVSWSDDPYGDIVALPDATTDLRGL